MLRQTVSYYGKQCNVTANSVMLPQTVMLRKTVSCSGKQCNVTANSVMLRQTVSCCGKQCHVTANSVMLRQNLHDFYNIIVKTKHELHTASKSPTPPLPPTRGEKVWMHTWVHSWVRSWVHSWVHTWVHSWVHSWVRTCATRRTLICQWRARYCTGILQ